jgi:hypothetical protein
MLDTSHYKDHKHRNNDPVPGTCEWFVSHEHFLNWNETPGSHFLWFSADPGSVKSVLAKHLIDGVLQSSNERTICYFFFKNDSSEQKTAANALCAMLRQIFESRRHLIRPSKLSSYRTDVIKLFQTLWEIFMEIAASDNVGEITCVLDALDECQQPDRDELLRAIGEFYASKQSGNLRLKFLPTSRLQENLRLLLHELETPNPSIHLSGEDEDICQKGSAEVDLVIQAGARHSESQKNGLVSAMTS